MSLSTHRRTDAYALAGQHLTQGNCIELPNSTFCDPTGNQREVWNIVVAIERGAAIGLHTERYSVGFIIGLLDVDLHAIIKRQFGKAVSITLFVDNGTRLWQLTHKVGGELLFLIRRIAQLLGCKDHLTHLIF